MHVKYAQLPPPEDSADRIFMTENAVIVLDGATAFAHVPVSAQDYASHLGHIVVQQLASKPDIDLRDAVAHAISRTANELNLSSGAAPSSTVSIVRSAPTGYDIFVLGDSPVLWGKADRWRVLSDDRLDQLDLTQRHAYQSRLRTGYGFDNQHREYLRALQNAQIDFRNIPRGYWIAETDPQAAHHAFVVTVPTSEADWIILATDGAFNLLDGPINAAWDEVAQYDTTQLTDLLQHLARWETEVDPIGQLFPRAKKHDDKSIVTIRSSPHRLSDLRARK